MNKLVQVITTIFTFFLSAFMLFGLFILTKGAARFVLALDPKLAATAITAFATVVVSVISILAAKFIERRAHVEQDLRIKKIPIYEKLIGLMFRIVYGEKLDTKLTENELLAALVEITRDLIIWGSPGVLKAFSDYRKIITQDTTSPAVPETMFAVEKIFMAIRKDLGHKDRNLKKGDVLRMYINDVDLYLKK